MKMKKLAATVLAALMLAGCGSSSGAAVPANSVDTGVGVALPISKGDYTKVDDDGFDFYFEGTDAAILGTIVTDDYLRCLGIDPKSITLNDYVSEVQSNNGFAAAQEKNGVPYFEYESDDGEFKYLYAMYRENNAFYDIQFGTFTEDYDSKRDEFLGYITGVSFYDYTKPDKEFDSGQGVKMTALADLQEVSYDADWSLEFGDATVMFYHFTEDLITSNGGAAGQTPEEHAQWQCDTFGYTPKNGFQKAGNYTYYEYDYADNGCTYYEAVFPASDGFWVVSAASMTENYEMIKPLYVKWLGTITVE